jgi:hypothetical protein
MNKYSGGLLLGMLMMSGCITDATVELTKAPFDATTALTEVHRRLSGKFLIQQRKLHRVPRQDHPPATIS